MSAFLGLASGFATGAGEEYSKFAEDKRKQDAAHDALVGQAIKEKLNDPTLDFESLRTLSNAYWDHLGVPKQMKDQLDSALMHHKADYDQHMAKQGQLPDMPVPAAQSPGSTIAGAGGAPDVQAPAQQLGPATSLPSLPPPPPNLNPTQGEMAAYYQRPLTQQAEVDKATAIRNAERAAKSGEVQDKLDLLHANENDSTRSPSEKQYVRRILGAEKQPTGMVRALTAPVYGKELKVMLGQDSLNGQPIEDTTRYIPLMDAAGQIIGGHEYTEPTTGKFVGPDTTSTTGWSEFQVDRTGKILGQTPGAPPPTAYAPQVVNGQRQEWVDFGDHKELKTVYSGSTRQRVLPGSAGESSVTPTTTGATPATATVNGKPMPGQPIPKSANGPTSRSSQGPTSIPKNLTTKQAMDTRVGIEATDRAVIPIQRMLDNIDVLQNPAIAAAIQDQSDPNIGQIMRFISGKMLDNNPRAAQFAADVRAATEDVNKIRGAFGATAFRGHDAFQAMTALVASGQLLSNKDVLKDTLSKTVGDLQTIRDEQAKVVGISPKYNTGANPYPTTATPATPLPTPAGKLRVIRKSDGVPGTINAEDFDEKKYTKVGK